MSSKKSAFVEARERLLEHITESLRADERFLAAWLIGSYGRGDNNWTSDLDIHVIVADAYSESLCAKPWMDEMRTTPERLALFQQFGTPSIVVDAHYHNMLGGTFTYVLYEESGHNVDWMLIPKSRAFRGPKTLVLFDKVGFPEISKEQPESQEQRIARASKNAGFFWMSAAGNVKNLINHDLGKFHQMLQWQEGMVREVQSALRGERPAYTNHTTSQVYPTVAECIAVLRRMCDEMESLTPALIEMGCPVATTPRAGIDMRIALLEEVMD